ncbi:MAG: DUF1587 domain-containing protein, partial [Verrucomicrobia bacterium]|nr:DUF1587 domain-containing protein [Verrucomicrobiota bacterium]
MLTQGGQDDRVQCRRMNLRFLTVVVAFLLAAPSCPAALSGGATQLFRDYCYDCHDSDSHKGDLNLEALASKEITSNTTPWEKVVRELNARQMPPAGKRRPDEEKYKAAISELTGILDAASAKNPDPGRTETFRRLNRTEYQNAIRDLLSLQIDATALLPRDEGSHGFDNVTVGTLPPTLLDRYLTAARKISQLAVGSPLKKPGGETYRVAADVTQEDQVEGLPIGTRGGLLIRHTFPQDGEYEFQVRLARDRNEEIEGLNGNHQLELLLDGAPLRSFNITRPRVAGDYESVDGPLRARLPISAGPRQVGVTFVDDSGSLLERKRQPYAAAFNMHRHPRPRPAVYQVSITGPHHSAGPGDTPSRRRIFRAMPANASEENRCAEQN